MFCDTCGNYGMHSTGCTREGNLEPLRFGVMGWLSYQGRWPEWRRKVEPVTHIVEDSGTRLELCTSAMVGDRMYLGGVPYRVYERVVHETHIVVRVVKIDEPS